MPRAYPSKNELDAVHQHRLSIERFLCGRGRDAAAALCELLHHSPNRHLAWQAIAGGLCPVRDRSQTGVVRSFASSCLIRKRLDVLEAVHAAGVPDWLMALPQLDAPSKGLQAVGFRLPRGGGSMFEWLQDLCSYDGYGGSVHQHSIYDAIAHNTLDTQKRPSALTRDALKFALRVDTDPASVQALASTNPAVFAIAMELQMTAHLQVHLEAHLPAPSDAADLQGVKAKASTPTRGRLVL